MRIAKVKFDKIPLLKESSMALGFFDGVHLGHQKVIKNTIKFAQDNNLKAAVFTFSKKPSDILEGRIAHPSTFTTKKEKYDFLDKMGINYLIVLDITKEEMKKHNHVSFVKKILLKLNVKHISCGEDFRFGKDGLGMPEDILEISKNKIKIDVVKNQKFQKQKISSSVIKELLKKGELTKANKLLGRYYNIVGKVSKGFGNGRKIGFRTANINLDEDLDFPLLGVFAVEVFSKNTLHHGIANVGYRPSINSLNKLKLEVHIFNFNRDIYDENIKVNFLKFIRKEKTFTSINFLRQQIINDIEKAKKVFIDK